MPVDARPLFRPDVVLPHVAAFALPASAEAVMSRLRSWHQLLMRPAAGDLKETEILPDFLADVFTQALGYKLPVDRQNDGTYTFSRERHVQVEGEFADAVLGRFGRSQQEYVIAVEGKGPKDPLDRPFGGRRFSAVDQAYRYAINLPCGWLVVTNIREIRLYYKGADQRTYEQFAIRDLATDVQEYRRFVFLLGADRVVPEMGPGHLAELRLASVQAGKELTQDFYAEYAQLRRDVLAGLRASNQTEHTVLLGATQKLLDRVLFIAFAEDRGLLPSDTLLSTYESRNPYNPQPVWDNFLGLFRAIDAGNEALNIPGYNGGLFAEDPVLDHVSVSDDVCKLLKRLGEFDYRAPTAVSDLPAGVRLVDVEILGHIFEQSITALEKLRKEPQVRVTAGQAGQVIASRHRSRRHREGAIYTPAFVTSYIVENALGRVLRDRFEEFRDQQQRIARGTARHVLLDPQVYAVDQLNKPQRDALIRFWEGWIDELSRIRILDPACGSGAFLVEAFDAMHAQYQQAVDRLAELRGGEFVGSLFDPDRTILQQNLYGVDLNNEAIEIARLSIWIKTAQRGRALTDLDHNIIVGNSIVTDSAVDPRALNWRHAFPEVYAQGGFDVVIGNPPYVRAEQFTSLKLYLSEAFQMYHGQADLYVYFFEFGLRVLRPGGRLSYVVTNKWLKAGYGGPLRSALRGDTQIEEIVDFGHAKQIFPDADVFPCIILVKNLAPAAEAVDTPRACTIPRHLLQIDNLRVQVDEFGFDLDQVALGAAGWTLEPPGISGVLDRMRSTSSTLREYVGADPKYGIKTGHSEAFLISTAARNYLLAADAANAEIVRPYLRGRDLKRWTPAWGDQWMIVLPSSTDREWPWSGLGADEAEGVFADAYPSIHAHMKRHQERLSGRQDQGVYWWELRSCAYYEFFEQPKLVMQRFAYHSRVGLDRDRRYINDSAILLPTADLWLLAVLNSPAFWYFAYRTLPHKKDEALAIDIDKVVALPIPVGDSEDVEVVSQSVRALMDLTEHRRQEIDNLLDWLRVEFDVIAPGATLSAPAGLSPDEFAREVKRRRGGREPFGSADLRRIRQEYERSVSPMVDALTMASQLERQIASHVHHAYGLTPENEALMWKTAVPRMPLTGPSDVDAGEEGL